MISELCLLNCFGSYLKSSSTSSGGSSPLILEPSTIPSGVITCSFSISFLHPFIFFLSYLRHFPFPFYVLVLLFTIRFLSCFLLSYMFFIFTHHHLHHHIIVFSLCPLDVNLHTYLTTWLSSCPVRIFFGFLTIFLLKNKKS